MAVYPVTAEIAELAGDASRASKPARGEGIGTMLDLQAKTDCSSVTGGCQPMGTRGSPALPCCHRVFLTIHSISATAGVYPVIAWLMGVTFLGLMGYVESRAFRETPASPLK